MMASLQNQWIHSKLNIFFNDFGTIPGNLIIAHLSKIKLLLEWKFIHFVHITNTANSSSGLTKSILTSIDTPTPRAATPSSATKFPGTVFIIAAWTTWISKCCQLPATFPTRVRTHTEPIPRAATPPSWLRGAGAVLIGGAGGGHGVAHQWKDDNQQQNSHLKKNLYYIITQLFILCLSLFHPRILRK